MKNKKRVLFVAHIDNHIQAFHIPFLKLFKDNDYIVDVASNGNSKFKYCDHKYNSPFQRTPFSLDNLRAYTQLKKILNENNYDIIHCHTPVGGFITRLANKNCNYYEDTKIIYTAHGFHFFNNNNFFKNFLFKNIEKYAAKYTDILITINQEDYNAGQHFQLKNNGKLFLIPGVGINLDYINQVRFNKNTFMNSLNIPIESKILLSVGELNTNKNHIVVLKALKTLPHYFHYVICGDGDNKTKLLKEIHHLELDDRVHILGYKKNIYEIMKCCDFFLFPSKREGLSVALMEAMACEMVCIVSNVRGNIDLIDKHLGGYVLDLDKFTLELPSILLQKDDIYNKMIDYNKKKLNQYSLDTILEKMRIIYGLE